jgi:hypothetical protein
MVVRLLMKMHRRVRTRVVFVRSSKTYMDADNPGKAWPAKGEEKHKRKDGRRRRASEAILDGLLAAPVNSACIGMHRVTPGLGWVEARR